MTGSEAPAGGERRRGATELFWLGSRTEAVRTDFDGRPRRCRYLGRAGTQYGTDVVLAEADPPLPGQERDERAVLRLHRAADSWDDLGRRWLPVLVGLADGEAAARVLAAPVGAVLGADEYRSLGFGEVAAAAEQLPPTEEASWERAYEHLQRYAAREGDARVPPEHVEGDLRLGVWVHNLRFEHARGKLTRDRARRLEALPGWEW